MASVSVSPCRRIPTLYERAWCCSRASEADAQSVVITSWRVQQRKWSIAIRRQGHAIRRMANRLQALDLMMHGLSLHHVTRDDTSVEVPFTADAIRAGRFSSAAAPDTDSTIKETCLLFLSTRTALECVAQLIKSSLSVISSHATACCVLL